MPSTSPFTLDPSPSFQLKAGTLYVVATPIGHLRDITLRALDVLKSVTLVAAEDTRHSGRLLSLYGIRTRLISYHDHNEKERTPYLIGQLLAGKTVALVSDAGTPTVSDPGYVLIQQAAKCGIPVTPIPGVSSVTAALSISGLTSKEYLFVGFIEKKSSGRTRKIEALSGEPRTLIIFESPKRILSLIRNLIPVFGDREAVLCRELTKHHEEVVRGQLSQIEERLSERSDIKGECTLLVSGAERAEKYPIGDLKEALKKRLSVPGASLPQVVREIADCYGLAKRSVYDEALRVKDECGS